MSATIHSFPYRHSGRRLPPPVQDARSFASDAEFRQRSIANAIVLCFLIALTAGGLWVFSELTSTGRPDNCVHANRGACGALTLAR